MNKENMVHLYNGERWSIPFTVGSTVYSVRFENFFFHRKNWYCNDDQNSMASGVTEPRVGIDLLI